MLDGVTVKMQVSGDLVSCVLCTKAVVRLPLQ